MSLDRRGTCPSCGAPLEFAVGSSRAARCRFCSALVARAGQDYTVVGKVADLVPTGARVSLGQRGTFMGEPFTVTGRVQRAWKQGVWDEWYVSFPEERWGWLAEAQGRYYVTFEVHGREVPARDHIAPGARVDLGRGGGELVVTDLKESTVASVDGELPDVVALGEATFSADLEGRDGTFATIDYGDGREAPQVFVGHEARLEDLALTGGAPAAAEPAPEGEALACPECGAPVTVRVPGQTVHLVCAHCNAMLDAGQGSLRLIEVLARHREEPPIPLGKTGTLRGAAVTVIGWMRRGCHVEGVHYGWEELLLYEPKTTEFSWLVRTDGHWSLAKGVPASEVTDEGSKKRYRDRDYKLFSSVTGVVERVLGEFYWAVRVNDQATLVDYIAPPEGLSLEQTSDEIVWSHLDYLEPEEVAAAFDLPEIASAPRRGVGSIQPWRFQQVFPAMVRVLGGAAAAVVVICIALAARGSPVLATHDFSPDELASVDPTIEEGEELPQGAKVHTYLSDAFDVPGHRAVEIEVRTSVDNSWVYVEGGLIEEESGDVSLFDAEASYYHGVEGGEAWSEGSSSASQVLPAPPKGSYVLRADIQWDPTQATPPEVTIIAREQAWSGWQLVDALLALLGPLGLLLWNRFTVEKKRWEESNVGGGS